MVGKIGKNRLGVAVEPAQKTEKMTEKTCSDSDEWLEGFGDNVVTGEIEKIENEGSVAEKNFLHREEKRIDKQVFGKKEKREELQKIIERVRKADESVNLLIKSINLRNEWEEEMKKGEAYEEHRNYLLKKSEKCKAESEKLRKEANIW